MKITVNFDTEIKPFTVPNYVISINDKEAIPLHRMTAETLEKLCADFRASVFEKAEKELPQYKERPLQKQLPAREILDIYKDRRKSLAFPDNSEFDVAIALVRSVEVAHGIVE